MVGEFCDAGDVLLSNVCVYVSCNTAYLFMYGARIDNKMFVSKKAQTPVGKKERKATRGGSCIMRFLSSDLSSLKKRQRKQRLDRQSARGEAGAAEPL